MVPPGGRRRSSCGRGPVATHRWPPWRAAWVGRTRPRNSTSCMRKAGTSTWRASLWSKSVSTEHCKLCTRHEGRGPWTEPQDRGSAECLLEKPRGQFHLPFNSSLLQNQLIFDREIIPLRLKTWLLPPRRSCLHLGAPPFHIVHPPALYALPGQWLVLFLGRAKWACSIK